MHNMSALDKDIVYRHDLLPSVVVVFKCGSHRVRRKPGNRYTVETSA